MPTYLFIGRTLPDTNRVNTPDVSVTVQEDRDRPHGRATAGIHDNKVFGRFETERMMSAVEIATVKNIVEDIASNLANTASVCEGTWTKATIDTCIGPDSAIAMRFSTLVPAFSEEMRSFGVTGDRVLAITCLDKGHFFRQAIADINAAFMNPKFFRTNAYRALEALRISICGPVRNNKAPDWQKFVDTVGIKKEEKDLLQHEAERHGDYENAQHSRADEVVVLHRILGKAIAGYVQWAEQNLITKVKPRDARDVDECLMREE